MEDQDWLELLSLLIQGLEKLQAQDLIQEIRTAISARIVEDRSNQLDFGVSPSVYKDVGHTITRPSTPKEAFQTAVEVLETRLIHFPQVVHRTCELLNRQPSQVQWRFEERSYLFSRQEQLFAEEMVLEDKVMLQVKELTLYLSRLLLLTNGKS